MTFTFIFLRLLRISPDALVPYSAVTLYHLNTHFIYKMMTTLLAIYTEENPASLTPLCGCLCHRSLVSSRSKREKNICLQKELYAILSVLLYNRAAVIS